MAAVFAVGAIRDAQPGMRDIDELTAAISDVQGYECENKTDIGDTTDFGPGTARQRFCTLYDGERQVFEDGDALEMVLVTPPEAMDEFVAYNRRTTRTTAPAIVGENWFILGLGGEVGERVRRDLLGGLEGAREGEYGIFQRR